MGTHLSPQLAAIGALLEGHWYDAAAALLDDAVAGRRSAA